MHTPRFGNCWSRGLMCHKLFAFWKKIKDFIESDTFKEDPKRNLTPPNYLANPSCASSSILARFATHETCQLALFIIWHTQCPTRGTQNHKWKLSEKRSRRPFVTLKDTASLSLGSRIISLQPSSWRAQPILVVQRETKERGLWSHSDLSSDAFLWTRL